MTFSHEKLDVYQLALAFSTRVSSFTSEWESRHSIQDQLPRAADSIVDNIAMASATHSAMKVKSLDYAVGSTLECAACLDIASIKQLLDEDSVLSEKDELCQVLKMLIGLRRSWAGKEVREDPAQYGSDAEAGHTGGARDNIHKDDSQRFFHHETLDVYMVSLQMFTAFSSMAESVARLDLYAAQGVVPADAVPQMKGLLARISSMTLVMMKTAQI